MIGQILWSAWLPQLLEIAKILLAYASSYIETLSSTQDFQKFAAVLEFR